WVAAATPARQRCGLMALFPRKQFDERTLRRAQRTPDIRDRIRGKQEATAFRPRVQVTRRSGDSQ
ncbi:hypothetical protein NO135_23135, partial [Clostridioides difficile]|nr:hypothetical protein [Clostridioides difficile]